MKLQLICETEPDAEAASIREKLLAFNTRQSGGIDWRLLQVFLRDDQNAVRGGLLGWTVWSWLHIDSLWVDEELRGQGWGNRLLKAAEMEAESRNCQIAEVDTFNFQARGFYEQAGYEVFGTLSGVGGGRFERYYLRKVLQPGVGTPMTMRSPEAPAV